MLLLGILAFAALATGFGLSWKSLQSRYWVHRLEKGDARASGKLKELMPAAAPHLVDLIQRRTPIPDEAAMAYFKAAKLLASMGPEGEALLLRRIELLRSRGDKTDNMLAALGEFPGREARLLYTDGMVSGRINSVFMGGFSAVEVCLFYLACRQEQDGSWDADRWGAEGASDLEVSSLALLAYLGAGHTLKEGRHKKSVAAGLGWISGQQRADGRIGEGWLREHVLAGLVLAEAFGLTKDPRFRAAARKALAFTLGRQLKLGGWAESPSKSPDAFLSTLCLLQLKSCALARIPVKRDALEHGGHALLTWMVVREGRDKGLARPREGCAPTPRSIACGGLVRFLISGHLPSGYRGLDALDPQEKPPHFRPADELYRRRAEAMRDPWATWLGQHFHFCVGGKHWQRWNDAVKDELLLARPDKEDPRGPWPRDSAEVRRLGRVGTVALQAMVFEVYYRYLSVYQGPGVDRIGG